jgi:hypothetical protein
MDTSNAASSPGLSLMSKQPICEKRSQTTAMSCPSRRHSRGLKSEMSIAPIPIFPSRAALV